MIMIRTLHADYRKYQSRDTESEAEETGWKLLHADVFRAPEHRILLAVFYGFGAQVFAGGITTLGIFFLLAFLFTEQLAALLDSFPRLIRAACLLECLSCLYLWGIFVHVCIP